MVGQPDGTKQQPTGSRFMHCRRPVPAPTAAHETGFLKRFGSGKERGGAQEHGDAWQPGSAWLRAAGSAGREGVTVWGSRSFLAPLFNSDPSSILIAPSPWLPSSFAFGSGFSFPSDCYTPPPLPPLPPPNLKPSHSLRPTAPSIRR